MNVGGGAPRVHGWSQAFPVLLVALAVTTSSAPLAWAYMTGNYAWAVAVSNDGRYAIAGSDDTYAYFFDTQSSKEGKPLWSYMTHGYVRHVAISRNGTQAAASDISGNVFFFRSNLPGQPVWSFQAGSAIGALAMSEDGDYLVAGDRRGTLHLFKSAQEDGPIWESVIPGGVLALSFSQSRVLAATATRGGLYFFNETGSGSGYTWVFQEYTSFPYLAITSDASYVVAGGSDGYIYLLNRSGDLISRQRLGGAVSALSMSATTRRVVAGSTDGNVCVYSIGNGLEKLSSKAIRRPVTSTVLSDDSERVSVANLDGEILMFNGSLEASLWTFSAGAIVHSLSMSSSGLVMAASSDNGNIYFFDEEAHKGTNETAASILLVPVVIGGFAFFAYMVWRAKSNSGAGKPYDHRKRI